MKIDLCYTFSGYLHGRRSAFVWCPRARNKLGLDVLRHPELRKALAGRFQDHHRFMLEQILGHIDFLDELIEKVSQEVTTRAVPFEVQMELLDTIVGMDRKTVEVGIDMDQFPTHRHLASWSGICPGNNESAGKRKSGKTTKGNRWLRRALIQAAWAAARSKDTYLSAQYQRLVRRRGKKKAVVAVAHSLLVIAYHVLRNQSSYRELGADYFDRLNLTHLKRYHLRRLENLGFQVTLEPLKQAP